MIQLKCFHGTSKANADSILRNHRFNPSVSDDLRLGAGAYFFNQRGSDPTYTIMCAKELRRYKYNHNSGENEYAILSCTIECDDELFFDLCDPDTMEAFHKMRYKVHERNLKSNPQFQYQNASQADTQAIIELKKITKIALIRAPQFFGMFEKEQRMKFSGKHISQNPRTFIPNVINICADTNLAKISDIQIVDEGGFEDEREGFIG